MVEIKAYKDLIVWQKAIKLVISVYETTEKFPKEEIYVLVSQIRRCAISIPSNIAEGRGRGTKKDFVRFLRISLGSANELQTQIEIAKGLPKTAGLEYRKIEELLIEVIKMLDILIKNLSS